MNLSEYLKPALGVAFFVVLGAGYYWFEHRSHPEEKETPGQALVIVTKSTNACFSDMVRVTGFIVPRREAQVGVDQEGSKVTDLFVHEGDMVTDNQELARLTPPPQQQGGGARPTSISLRAPGPGLVDTGRPVLAGKSRSRRHGSVLGPVEAPRNCGSEIGPGAGKNLCREPSHNAHSRLCRGSSPVHDRHARGPSDSRTAPAGRWHADGVGY